MSFSAVQSRLKASKKNADGEQDVMYGRHVGRVGRVQQHALSSSLLPRRFPQTARRLYVTLATITILLSILVGCGGQSESKKASRAAREYFATKTTAGAETKVRAVACVHASGPDIFTCSGSIDFVAADGSVVHSDLAATVACDAAGGPCAASNAESS